MTDRPIPSRKNMSAPGAAVRPGTRASGPVTADDAPADSDPMQFDQPPDEPPSPPRPAPTFTIHALLDDFPLDVSFSGTAEQLAATIRRLREIGAVPPTPAARQAVEEEKQRTAPICEFHGPMKESTKAPGTWFCTKKMGDGSYCKSKA